MGNIDRFKKGLTGESPSSEITAALKADFGDTYPIVMAYLSVFSNVSSSNRKTAAAVFFTVGSLVGAAFVLLIGVAVRVFS